MKSCLHLFFALLVTALASAAPARAADATDHGRVAATLVERGDAALDGYDASRCEAVGAEFSSLYFDVFEASGMEFALAYRDNGLKLAIEMRFAQLISQAIDCAPAEEMQPAWRELSAQIVRAGEMLGGEAPWVLGAAAGTALQAGLIVLREGIEAMLVISALVAYLRRSGQHGHVVAVGWGVGLAVLASLATAWGFAVLLAANGALREVIEGVCLLAAAALLAWVSLWVYSRREAVHWQQYLRERVDAAVATDSAWAMVLTAFLAVYREGAETVLFLQALAGGSGAGGAVAAGALAAGGVLAALWFVFARYALRLPVKPFFTATALLLFVLAVVFAGKGVLELQVAGWMAMTRIAGVPEWPQFGVFPTVETLSAQGAVLAACALALAWAQRRPAPRAAAGRG